MIGSPKGPLLAEGPLLKADICVIGAGAGGLSYAAGAAQMGADVVLIEQDKMGGDCLNAGCVPSKALLAAAKAAVAGRKAETFGVTYGPAKVTYAAVLAHVHNAIAQIAPHDSRARFEGLGVHVIAGTARFVDTRTVAVATQRGAQQIRAKRFIIATGSRPLIPAIPGLDQVPYLTNESLWDLKALPEHLLVIGGGAIGLEMALAHQRLGAQVSLIEAAQILPNDDRDMVAVAREALIAEGLRLIEGAKVTRVAGTAGTLHLTYQKDGQEQRLSGSHVLVATGRVANVETLGLAAAKVPLGPRGIEVDARQRTRNPRVFAVGDVAGDLQFTHYASHQAAIALQNTLLPPIPFRPATRRCDAVPWVTFLDPEVAQVGLNETTAKAQGIAYRVERAAFTEADRLVAEGQTKGFVKVLIDRRNRVIGAGIVGPKAGELIHFWALGVYRRSKITALASYLAPYPTAGEINKKVIGKFIAPKLFGPLVQRIVRFWLRFLS